MIPVSRHRIVWALSNVKHPAVVKLYRTVPCYHVHPDWISPGVAVISVINGPVTLPLTTASVCKPANQHRSVLYLDNTGIPII
jgi:hypothetical protein